MKVLLAVLSRKEIEEVHRASVQLLTKTGMRFESSRILDGLQKAGARVDKNAGTVRFTEPIVGRAIENTQKLMRAGKRLHLLNGVTSEITTGDRIQAKISGGCEHYLDWKTQSLQEASAEALLQYIRLGELLPEVRFVGNPIVIRRDFNGAKIEERLRRVKTAALIAKNTQKVGSMEVWNKKEIDLLVEIGTVIRGSRAKYYESPCLVTAKETISPLFLDAKAGNILLALAERGLPCTIIPMPISGVSTPVTPLGNLVIANAEILGVMCAVQSVYPEALVGGGVISGVLDMRTGAASFSAPEAILQDIALSEIHQKLYGWNFMIGSGYTDAKYPNSQTVAEKALKFLFTCLSGRTSYPVGLINGGSAFSAEQALVDLEICRNIHAHFRSFNDSESTDELLALIDEVGIRGHFMETEHTLQHFRENWLPQIWDRSGFTSIEDSRAKDLYHRAHEQLTQLMSSGEHWHIDREKEKEIDAIVDKAEAML